MSLGGYLIIGLFALCWATAALSVLWMIFFTIRMVFKFSEKGSAFSKETLWNPLNAVFKPELLSDEGRRHRTKIIYGAIAFFISMAVAVSIGAILTYLGCRPLF